MNKLYKYVTPESIQIILESSSIKIANPVNFNDPFDCNIPNFDINTKDFIKMIGKNLAGTRHDLNEILFGADEDINDFKFHCQSLSKELSSAWGEVISIFRVLSLTERFDNILMWSHYAEQHKGAVIGFNKSDHSGFIRDSKLVDYKNGKIKFEKFSAKLVDLLFKDLITNDDKLYDKSHEERLIDMLTNSTLNFFKSYFFFKKNEWNYEKEHRLVLRCDSNDIKKSGSIDTISFDTSDICEIIFGVKADLEIVRNCSKISKEKYPKAELYQMEKLGWNLERRKI